MKITSNNQSPVVSTPSKTKNAVDNSGFDPSKPLDFLDDKGNKILDKLLEGRSSDDKIFMKIRLNMTFHYIPSLEHGNQLHYVSNIPTDSNSIINTMQDFYDNNKGNTDPVGFYDVVKEFLSLYTKETTPEKTLFTEETKSKNLEQFYEKDVQQAAEKTKVALSQKDEITKTKTTSLKDALEVTN